jgi:hypothetical protein
MSVPREYFIQTFGSADWPTETCLKPRYVMLYVGIHELFAIRDYDTQGSSWSQYAKKLAQDGQPEFCINMFENMLGKYQPT